MNCLHLKNTPGLVYNIYVDILGTVQQILLHVTFPMHCKNNRHTYLIFLSKLYLNITSNKAQNIDIMDYVIILCMS